MFSQLNNLPDSFVVKLLSPSLSWALEITGSTTYNGGFRYSSGSPSKALELVESSSSELEDFNFTRGGLASIFLGVILASDNTVTLSGPIDDRFTVDCHQSEITDKLYPTDR